MKCDNCGTADEVTTMAVGGIGGMTCRLCYPIVRAALAQKADDRLIPREKIARDLDYQTPQKIVDAVHVYASAFEGLALDPATVKDNPVGAECWFYPPTYDGLDAAWTTVSGRPASQTVVFVNPPYGKKMPAWIRKVHAEARRGLQILLLITTTRTEQGYFQRMMEDVKQAVFFRGRVPFTRPSTGEPANQNISANVLYGLNTDAYWMNKAFAHLGLVLKVQSLNTPPLQIPWRD